jgi:hexokinase
MLQVWQLLTAAFDHIVMIPSFMNAVLPSLQSQKHMHDVVTPYDNTMDDFLRDVKRQFEAPINAGTMLAMSSKLQEQYKQKLESSHISMLPTYNHTLPTGQERGTYLALDVGGSTFRVALVELSGRSSSKESMRILKMRSDRIDNRVKALKGNDFFDWMADRISETLADPDIKKLHLQDTLAMGLAWSFPVEYDFTRIHLAGKYSKRP